MEERDGVVVEEVPGDAEGGRTSQSESVLPVDCVSENTLGFGPI